MSTALPRGWQNRIGYVPQSIGLFDATVGRNIAFATEEDEIAEIDDFVCGRLPEACATFVGECGVRMSGGQRQRIGIARTPYRNPEILVLDEATNSLDRVTEARVLRSIRSLSARPSIIIVSHRISAVRICDPIHLPQHGRVADSGTYEELLARCPDFAALTG